MNHYLIIILLLLIIYQFICSKKINQNTYAIMNICDINHDNKLNFREFNNCSVDKKKSKNVFDYYDLNNSKYLDLNELNLLII